MVTWTTKAAVREIKLVQQSKGDFIIVISGFRGVGKSTLQARFIQELMGDGILTEEGFKRHFIYSRRELDKKLEEFKEDEPICVDEGINLLFKREFQNRDQNIIIKKFNTYRDKHFVIFLLLPNFWDLDSSIRNSSMIKWWIHCSNFGKGVIYQPEDNEWNPDPWNQKNNFIATRKGIKNFSLPNYVANIIWDELPEDVYEIYKKVKAEKRRAAYDETGSRQITKNDLIKGLLSYNLDINAASLAEMLKTDKSYIYEIKRKITTGV